MSTGESFESRFEKIDVTLKDPKSEVNVDCLLIVPGSQQCCQCYNCIIREKTTLPDEKPTDVIWWLIDRIG